MERIPALEYAIATGLKTRPKPPAERIDAAIREIDAEIGDELIDRIFSSVTRSDAPRSLRSWWPNSWLHWNTMTVSRSRDLHCGGAVMAVIAVSTVSFDLMPGDPPCRRPSEVL